MAHAAVQAEAGCGGGSSGGVAEAQAAAKAEGARAKPARQAEEVQIVPGLWPRLSRRRRWVRPRAGGVA